MYARHECHHLIGAEMEAGLLVELLTSWIVMMQSSPDSFNSVRGLGHRIDVLLDKAVYGFRLVQACARPARSDGRPCALGHAPSIHRLILSDRLYYPGPVVGHKCIPELLFLCFYGEVVQAGVQLELSFCPGHVVVGQVRQQCYALVVWAPAPHRRIEVAVYASGNS